MVTVSPARRLGRTWAWTSDQAVGPLDLGQLSLSGSNASSLCRNVTLSGSKPPDVSPNHGDGLIAEVLY